MALGARRGRVWGMVIYQGMRLTLAGTLAGALAASLLTRLLRGQLFEVGAFDLSTFGLTCLILYSVALAACFIPAWRASKVDPMVALRSE
jgi:ABC-type antimicrobial peptide transport system permease subunit